MSYLSIDFFYVKDTITLLCAHQLFFFNPAVLNDLNNMGKSKGRLIKICNSAGYQKTYIAFFSQTLIQQHRLAKIKPADIRVSSAMLYFDTVVCYIQYIKTEAYFNLLLKLI